MQDSNFSTAREWASERLSVPHKHSCPTKVAETGGAVYFTYNDIFFLW